MLARLAFMAFLWQQAAKMSEFAIHFVMTKLTSVFLGPVGAGIYGVVGSTLGLILIGSLFGFEVSANNFLARNADNPNRISFLARALFSRRFVIVIILGLGMFIGAPALANITNIQNPVYYRFAALILIFSSTSSLLTYFQFALFRNKQAMFARVGSLIVQVALLLWFLRHGWGVRGALIAQTLGMAFMFTWFAVLGFKLMIPKPEPIPLKPIYKFGITLWVQDLMNFAISKSAAIWILSIFAVPMNLIGLCNAAFNVRMMVDGFFIQGMGATALAATARIAKQGSGERLPQAWLYNVKTATLLSAPPLIFFLLHTQAIISALTSKEFIPVTSMCRLLLFMGIIARIYGGGASSTVLAADGKERKVLLQFITGGITSIALAFTLVPLAKPYGYELYAVAFAMGLGSILTSALGFSAVKRIYSIKFPTIYTFKILLASTIATLPTIPFHSVKILSLVPATFVFLIVFLVLLGVLKPFNDEDVDMATKISKRMGDIVQKFAPHSLSGTTPLDGA